MAKSEDTSGAASPARQDPGPAVRSQRDVAPDVPHSTDAGARGRGVARWFLEGAEGARRRRVAATGTARPEGQRESGPARDGAAVLRGALLHADAPGEMWAITPRWIGRRAGLIRIPAGHSKSGEEETIPLHPRARRALLGQLAVRGHLKPDEPIFGEVNLRRAYSFALAESGIDSYGLTPHHFTRYTGATILAEKTKDREALKHAGRWRSNVVDDYIHSDVERARPLMSKLQERRTRWLRLAARRGCWASGSLTISGLRCLQHRAVSPVHCLRKATGSQSRTLRLRQRARSLALRFRGCQRDAERSGQ